VTPTYKAALVAINIVRARDAHRKQLSTERAFAVTAERLAIQLSSVLKDKPLDVLKLDSPIIGGVNWKSVAEAMRAAVLNPALYDAALQVVASEITDDSRLDEATASYLIIQATNKMQHIQQSAKNPLESKG
jgi:hypothetical protein